jgi:hypothetical protein
MPAYHIGKYSPRKYLGYILPIWISLFMVAGAVYPSIIYSRGGNPRAAQLTRQLQHQKKRLSQLESKTDKLESRKRENRAKRRAKTSEKRKKR